MIWLFTDTSPTGTVAWIGQGPTRDAARPAAFHSRKVTPSKSNYPTHQQETLAIIEAMEAFAPHLLHKQFTLVTDYESLTKLMTRKHLHGRQQRWLTHLSLFHFKIEYQPGAKNFLADYLSRIHEGTPGPLDISLKDPTIDYDSLELPDPTQPLEINTSYASSIDFSIESDDAMYHSGEAQTTPTLTSSDSISCCRPESLMDEITSNAVSRSQKRKAYASSPATSSAPSNDSRITIGNSWGDNRTLPIISEMEGRHSEMSWMSCTDDDCEIHKNDNDGASYWPKDPKVRKQSKKSKRKEQHQTSTSNTALEEGQASLPDVPYDSESLPPFRMNDTILATPPMASPACSPLYSQAGYDSDEATNANEFLSTLHSRLMGILAQRVRQALKTDARYTRVKETDNKLHYSIRDGLLLAQNTNGYENHYIPVGPLEKGVSLRDFILKTGHEGLGHFSAYKCYSYVACFFWWPQMRQDFALYCRSGEKCQINNEPTTLPYGRSLTLPDPDEAYQSLAIDFAGPFNKSEGYTSIMVILDRFTSYTHLIPLKDTATSEEIFKKLNSTVFDVHGLPLSIVFDQDSRFTSKFWLQMMKSLGILVWMATQSHHKMNGQVERRIRTLKQLMRNFVNPRQNN